MCLRLGMYAGLRFGMSVSDGSLMVHIGFRWVSNEECQGLRWDSDQACRSPMGLLLGMSVSDESPIRHVGL